MINWLRSQGEAARRRFGPAVPRSGDAGSTPTVAARPATSGARTAVVAACYDFPFYSHAFVYQEMLSLREMRFDLRLFCWRRADPSHLHAAFTDLWDHLHVLDSSLAGNVRDYRYYRDRMPERVSELMERLSVSLRMPVQCLENDQEVLMAFTFARAVEDTGADYIHTYFFYEETFYGMIASYLLDVPRGVSCYADHMLADSRFKDFGLQFEHLDIAVATSRRIATELRGLAGDAHAGKILVKPNGVDGSRFEMRERRLDVTEPVELLSISRIEPKKGLLKLCDLARLLKDAGRRARIHVVGAPDPATPGSVEYARTFQNRRRALNVEEMFVMHGFLRQEQMGPLLAAADAFVATYMELENGDKDGIPTSLLEAMASGVPVICTDAGSILEVVEDGVEALVIPGGDPGRMAAAVIRFLDEPGLARRLGQSAHQRFSREFDAKVTEPLLHERIDAILERRQRAAHYTMTGAQGI